MGSSADTIKQLNAARAIVLGDAALYPQIVPGILPVISPAATLPLRRWGSDFLAETFASPVIGSEVKQSMITSAPVLDTIKGYINRKEELGQAEDPAVLKSAVQCAASVFPLVFREAISTPTESEHWTKMLAIKSSILRQMDYLAAGVRICCIKFLAIVVLTQTAGLIADPRRPDQNEISLAMLNRNHAVLQVGTLEAEASGLLDRLLSTLEEESNNALLVTATINALSSLVHRRASISAKIIMSILTFNPLRSAGPSKSDVDRVNIRSMTRTTTSFFMNILKRNPQHNLAARIQQHIDRLRHALADALSDNNQLKRSAPDEPTDGLDDAKRQRIDQHATNGSTALPMHVAPLPAGIITAAQLFTLTDDVAAASFNVELLPAPIVAQLVPALIAAIDTRKLDWAINAIRGRYLEVTSRPPPPSAIDVAKRTIGAQDEDDDYDPATDFAGDNEQVFNALDKLPSTNIDQNIQIGPFFLPTPAPLSNGEAEEQSKLALLRLFGILAERDKETKKDAKPITTQDNHRGFSRPNLDPQSREGWVQTVVRIATRAAVDLESEDDDGENGNVKEEDQVIRTLIKRDGHFDLSQGIRDALFNYVMEDFRRRINDVILWFSDEWYVEALERKERQAEGHGDDHVSASTQDESPSRYTYWTLRFLDSIVPYLDVKDNRTLIRFYSEIPSLDARHLDRLVKVADDPERVNLAVQTLLYLIMLRPPVREIALDAMETLWRTNEDARKSAEKHLSKWRPDVIAKATEVEDDVKVET